MAPHADEPPSHRPYDRATDRLYADVGDPFEVRAAFDGMPIMQVALRGPDLRFVAVNEMYRSFVGRSGFVGIPAREVLPELEGQHIIEAAERAYATGTVEIAREWRMELERGSGVRDEVFVDCTFCPHREDGEVTGVDVLLIEVTEKVQQREATTREAAAARARYEEARATLDALQRELLPRGLPVLPGVQMAASYRLAERESGAGGDWFDAVPLPGGRVALVVGDVVGHGVPASATMGQLRTVLHHVLAETGSPVHALAALDRTARRLPGARAATVCVAVLDLADGTVRYCTAGHPPPLVLPASTPGSEPRYLPLTGSGPLVTGTEFVVRTEQLLPGEVLLMYSDGILERPGRSPAGATVELSQVADDVAAGRGLRQGGTTTVDRVCTQTIELLVRATGHADDITLLAVQRVPRTPALELRRPAHAASLASIRAGLGDWLAELDVGADDVVALQHAIGELVTNAVEHGYRDSADPSADVLLRARLTADGEVEASVADEGRWREPRPSPGRGIGLAATSGLVDDVHVDNRTGGTTVTVRRRVSRPARLLDGGVVAHGARYAADTAPAELTVRPAGDGRVLVSGPVDAATAPDLEQGLLVATAAGTRAVVLDLSGVPHLASAGVSVLHRQVAISRGNGTALRIVAPAGSPAQQILALTALEHESGEA